MTRIDWDSSGERYYEVGVDRGVLYLGDSPGVPWNGLISVTESSTGGEAKPYYLDGIKYLNKASSEEFGATIEAYTYPDEFSECDGSTHVGNGLYASQQVRRPFALAYRTKVGNDLDGPDHAYKIHLIYDALVAPSARAYSTVGDDPEPFNFSWPVTARPVVAETGLRPTSKFTVDSRHTPRDLMRTFLDILWGSETTGELARMPTVEELYFLFNDYSSSIFDAGDPNDPFFNTFDGGSPPDTVQTDKIDGGVA